MNKVTHEMIEAGRKAFLRLQPALDPDDALAAAYRAMRAIEHGTAAAHAAYSARFGDSA
jgi:hypothetical protein